MKQTKAQRKFQTIHRIREAGFSTEEAFQLLRIERTLHSWGEHECNGTIQRDETTDKPYWHNQHNDHRSPVADREKGALARLAKIMVGHPSLVAYHQTDPRGCALYILTLKDLRGCSIESAYSRGLAVCV